MKSIFRYIIFYSFALYVVSQLLPTGLTIHGGLKTIFIAGAIFGGLNLIVKPLIKAIAFPFIFFTLGLFSFVIDAGILFLLTRFIPDLQVHAFVIPKLAYNAYSIPRTELNIFFAYIGLSAIIAFISMFLRWISE